MSQGAPLGRKDVKFTAGRLGLGCDAIVPGRLWVVKFTASRWGSGVTQWPQGHLWDLGCPVNERQVGLGRDAMAPGCLRVNKFMAGGVGL